MPTSNLPSPRYYPRLSELISVGDLPEFLSFAENGLSSLLNQVHYQNLQFSKSSRGDSAFYSLDIVSKNLGLDLPFGMRLVLNPDENGNSAISSFPVTLEYQWEILAFLNSFNLQHFAFTPQAFYDLGLRIFKLSDAQVIAHILNYFVGTENITTDPFAELINAINDLYPDAHLSLPVSGEITVNELAEQITANVHIPEKVSQVMFALYIGSHPGQIREKLQAFFNLMVPDGIEAYINRLITPKVKASLTVSAGIEFPTQIIRPVYADGTPILNAKSLFQFGEATLFVDSEAGIGYQAELAGSLLPGQPAYHEIGNTGLLVSFDKAKLDLSRTSNIAEADAAGYPADFTGLYVKQASISLSKFGNLNAERKSAKLYAEDLLVGSGGISGRIGLEANGVLHRKFGEHFAAELNAFSLTFRQGSIVNSDIRGTLTIPTLKQGDGEATIGIQAHIQQDGDFNVTAEPREEPYTLTLPDVFDLHVRNLELGKENNHFYIQVAGKLDFIVDLPVLGQTLPKDIEIYRLRIWDTGEIEFEHGTITLPVAFRLQVGPVKLEVSQLALGSYARALPGVDPVTQEPLQLRYQFFGFDGMINTGRAGVNASGNGIKYYFSTNHDQMGVPFSQFMSIDGIAIDMSIPGNVPEDKAAFLLDGYLSMRNPDANIPESHAATEYSGSVSFTLPRINFSGSAGMRLQPDIPAFVVDIGMDLATPVPLGGTGLGIYGFRGLLGQHFMPAKYATHPPLDDSATWWEYFKAPSTITGREGIEIDKFASKPGFSVGAGVSIATAGDSGKIFSSKLFLLLGLPDVFLIQGQAGILRDRIGLNDDVDPPFSALIIFGDRSIRGNLGVNYNLPEGPGSKGAIFSLQGNLDMAFFFNNASGWYLNIGKDFPENERVRARILTLFQGHAYLMLSMQGIRAGAGVQGDIDLSVGPFGVGLGGFLRLGGFISVKPVQIGGYMQVGGYAYIRFWKFKISASINVNFGVEAPHPFVITGGLQVKVKVLFVKLTFDVDLTWRFNNDQRPLREPIAILRLPDESTGYLPAAAVNILSGETFPINYVTSENLDTVPPPDSSSWKHSFGIENGQAPVTIPLDSFVDIELLKPVRPVGVNLGGNSNQIAEGYVEMIPPQRGVSNQVRHEFELENLKILAWDPSSQTWKDYHIYEAVTAIVEANTGSGQVDLTTLKPGYWQFMQPNRFNKIRLLSQNMFSYSSKNTSAFPGIDSLNFGKRDVLCYSNLTKGTTIDWNFEPFGLPYPQRAPVNLQGATFRFNTSEAVPQYDYWLNNGYLRLTGRTGEVEILFPEPVAKCVLKAAVNENQVSLKFGQTVYGLDDNGETKTSDLWITQMEWLGQDASYRTFSYDFHDHGDQPIDKVILTLHTPATLDWNGDLVLGRHLPLPTTSPEISENLLSVETEKALQYFVLYNRSFSIAQAQSRNLFWEPGVVGRWSLSDTMDDLQAHHGVLTGLPTRHGQYYLTGGDQALHLNQGYGLLSNDEGLVVPYNDDLKVEEGSFAFEVTAVFNPGEAGVQTLVHKVTFDPASGHRKGYSLHLIQPQILNPQAIYSNAAEVPEYTAVLAFYHRDTSYVVTSKGRYTFDCLTGQLLVKQYHNILVSVDRVQNSLDLYLNNVSVHHTSLPIQLLPEPFMEYLTGIASTNFVTLKQQVLAESHPVTEQQMIDELQVMGDGLNKVLQPVWRPDTTYAVQVRTRDVVNGQATPSRTHIFGFQTAGPVGHFHQQNPRYRELAAADRKDEFKLATLKPYIDYQRSYPDAQGRYDLSKPVFLEDPQVRLFFTQPYMNAMYANWHGYHGLSSVESRLDVEIMDPQGKVLIPELIWESLPEQMITEDNLDALPPDLKILYQLNAAAAGEGCISAPINFIRKLKRGRYQFTAPLQPQRLYTALFKAVYNPTGSIPSVAEVHRFNFKTSRYANFQEQIGSLTQLQQAGMVTHALQKWDLALEASQLTEKVLPLINESMEDDPAWALRYGNRFDRLLYGGLGITQMPSADRTCITALVLPEGTSQEQSYRIIALLVQNPEPFNEPQLPAEELKDTIRLKLTPSGQATVSLEPWQYIHAADNSAVIITNTELRLPWGSFQLDFQHKTFNGTTYDVQTVSTDVMNLTDLFTR
jgi:hypothetical protein